MFPPIDPGSVAIGLLSGLFGWAVFLFLILPRFGRNLKADVKKEIHEELPKIIEEVTPIIKETFKDEMPDFDKLKEEFKAELPNFEDIKKEIKDMIPEIPTLESASEEVITLLVAKLGDKDDAEINAIFQIISARVVLGAISMIQNDPEIKQWMGGMFSHYGGKMMEKVEAIVGPLKQVAENYGVDFDNPEAGINIDKVKDNINIEDKLKVKFAVAADKMLDSWIDKLGKKNK